MHGYSCFAFYKEVNEENYITEYDLIKTIPVLLEKPFLEPGDKLVCFGDSLTARPNGYFHYLQEALTPRGIILLNAGLSGDKTPAALTRLERDVISHAPTAISIFFGTNDAVHGHGRWSHEPQGGIVDARRLFIDLKNRKVDVNDNGQVFQTDDEK